MATLTIRNVDEDLKARLRVRAAENGRSMEAEVRAILQAALEPPGPAIDIGSVLRRRFADMDDASFPLPERNELAQPAEFGQ
ncbi:FitA-like ribbon-helix-helix domain-containing protein [Phytoactinopolyspora halotolerans]|uniref:Arc family DNA-binding protein n=1 Tax=Phytoactinopolyspora halotolerans TaxID=1981512 RepID=A0A6L9SAF4_9ACTN|nr:Arc family DNA-binding protein [Phytoactinopolyspora halotolerans]NEE02107.1 Arc family DNA-binding protein [Phytoactinopolyspora halotolerans]